MRLQRNATGYERLQVFPTDQRRQQINEECRKAQREQHKIRMVMCQSQERSYVKQKCHVQYRM